MKCYYSGTMGYTDCPKVTMSLGHYGPLRVSINILFSTDVDKYTRHEKILYGSGSGQLCILDQDLHLRVKNEIKLEIISRLHTTACRSFNIPDSFCCTCPHCIITCFKPDIACYIDNICVASWETRDCGIRYVKVWTWHSCKSINRGCFNISFSVRTSCLLRMNGILKDLNIFDLVNEPCAHVVISTNYWESLYWDMLGIGQLLIY